MTTAFVDAPLASERVVRGRLRLARGRVWQGIRDWFRPVDGGARKISQRAGSGSRSERAGRSGSQNWGASGGTRSAGFSRRDSARAFLSAEGQNFGRGFRDGGSLSEATLDFDQNPDHDLGNDLGHDLAIDERELLDFIAADVDPVPADPAFRERLREELWEMVVADGLARPKHS
jgi:hypothetical protein